ncbi:response regulator [Candidatus Desulfosporosinus nitrosoreducens]|uniref:response regulator n=1 Tax=Candidatus Desulfosporosinus nitrosoreducens TaxID=3401928 RepID=UPI00280C0CC4|nr:response regulator [Desulfosporosinus sp. PR]
MYPGVLIRKLGISQSQAYKVLDALKRLGLLEVNYELYCHECGQFKGPIFETFGGIPDELDCEYCGERLDPLDNSIVIYKMISD